MTEFFKDLAIGVFILSLIILALLLFGGLIYYIPAWVSFAFIFGAVAWLIGGAFREINSD